ncbi:sigma 54-interacting transcriptional regulator [Poritiphilus flavus]|uniref:PAS domain S-box protein n=1 Tax=Poritiphilus flavus TaxID=2697053 RepID=A0A6L9EA83_9FLAO|nr:sigma 54-interacting transcriptional regulator [Poritiphilus flavus]NAS11492.1 PAS domain S-box protein [Poritiphilus flavus]
MNTDLSQWLIQALPYEVFVLNREGSIVYANDMFLNKLGYDAKDLNTLTIFNINSTVTKVSWAEHWEHLKEVGTDNFKEAHQNKKGKLYQVEVFAQFFSNNGNDWICALAQDITKSSFYNYLMESTEHMAKVGGWKLNLQDGSLIVTSEALKIFETKDKNDLLPGKVIHHFMEADRLKKLLSAALQKGTAYDEVLVIKGAQGNKKYLRCVAEPILKGKKVFKILGAYQDVTEQKTFETRLQLFRKIINNAEDLIYVYNREGKLLLYSNSVSTKLGFTKKELDGFTIYDLDPKITPEWWEGHFDEIVEKGVLRFEWLVGRKDGTKFPVDISANHIFYDGEDLNCAVIRDVSERKKRDVELFQALEEIKSLKTQLENENEYLKDEINQEINFGHIICQSKEYQQVLKKVDQVAPTDTTVLITGESGTGKELLARAIHENSSRKNRPLIKINAATLPSELIESELFGHKKGAFTGAVEDKIGKFKLADGGTIFLDEIGELPLSLQPKLLRFLQEGEFDELGSNKTIKVDIRVIAATNRDLEKMVADGKFRVDLYYRLNVFPIYNIPLRERKDDIPVLAKYFLEKYSNKAGKAFRRLSKKTITALMNYNYPGNIRELENLIERAVIIENGTTLNPGSWIPIPEIPAQIEDFKSLEAVQREHILNALKQTNWRVSGPKGAASILEVKDKTLFAKMKRLGIERQTNFR